MLYRGRSELYWTRVAQANPGAAKACRSVRTAPGRYPGGGGQVQIEDLHDDVSRLDVGPVLQEVDREVLAPAAKNVGEVALPAPRVPFIVIAIPVGDPPGEAVVHRLAIHEAPRFERVRERGLPHELIGIEGGVIAREILHRAIHRAGAYQVVERVLVVGGEFLFCLVVSPGPLRLGE